MELTIGPETASAEVRVTEAVEGIFRVERAGATVGYVHRVGRVYVALSGSVYNTAVEVAQTLDLDTAAEHAAGAERPRDAGGGKRPRA